MRVEVVGKNGFNPSSKNKEYAEKKLDKVSNLLDNSDEVIARVVCKVYKEYHKVEVTIPTKKHILRAEVIEPDLYAAIDKSIDKLVAQIKRYKEKNSRKSKDGIKTAALVDEVSGEEVKEAKLVRDKEIDLIPMSCDEAIDQMELLGHDFFIYLDKATRKVNVIYLRDDGDYAVIQTKTK